MNNNATTQNVQNKNTDEKFLPMQLAMLRSSFSRYKGAALTRSIVCSREDTNYMLVHRLRSTNGMLVQIIQTISNTEFLEVKTQ